MCGIGGLIFRDRQRVVEERTLAAMRDPMIHRGPDERGVFSDGNVGLIHQRLSIIDLSTGSQPMSTADGRFTIVFNGEIYNYLELRRELEDKGHQFRTQSDTEVILLLYAELGQEAIPRLNGIFAFAIYEKDSGQLLMARDRMGIKPLYYTDQPAGLAFASEIKSLFLSGLIAPSCNAEAVPEYFIFRHIAGEKTLFRGVYSLPPAHILVFKGEEVDLKRYWSIYNIRDMEIGFGEAVDELDLRLRDAVQRQLISDVPLGTFCSGGLDSSLITAFASMYMEEPVNTYSVGFHEETFDESRYARMVSEAYGTRHHEIKVSPAEFAEELPRLVWHNDEPLNFPNSVQIYAISRLAKKRVTVVLTGEGADELFGGYPRYFIPQLLGPITRMPKLFKQLSSQLLSIWNDHRLEKLGRYATKNLRDILVYNAAVSDPENINQLLLHKFSGVFDYRESLYNEGLSRDLASRLALMDQQTYLLSILNRQDKMSMAASVEARVPFLDNQVIDLANALMTAYKMRFPRRKKVLMAVADRYLPREVINRRKSGFGVPLKDWFKSKGAFSEYLSGLADSPYLKEYFDSGLVNRIIESHRKGEGDHSEFIWSALNFVIWRDLFKA